MSGRDGRLSFVLAALAVLALVAVVAVASTGSTSAGTSAGRRPSDVLLDSFFSLALLALIPGALLLIYGLSQRQAIAREIASGRYPRTSFAAFMVFILVFSSFVYFGYRRFDIQLGGGPGGIGEIGPGGRARAPEVGAGDEDAYVAEFAWIPALVVLTLLGLVVAALWTTRRRRPVREADAIVAEELADVLDDTLDDLRAERNPRRAVVAAYARLERALAASGMPRQRAETAHEHVGRALAELEVDADAVHALAGLYTEARFSRHEIDDAMKVRAIDILVQVRDELRLLALAAREHAETRKPPQAVTS